ncbi:MAG: hypothetical protein ICV81_12880 [Flavisolibacter sp.]|nr:hypothetical protein [Flavisolibacter sp.]
MRKRSGGAPNQALYNYKVEWLKELERLLSTEGIVDLLYGYERGCAWKAMCRMAGSLQGKG